MTDCFLYFYLMGRDHERVAAAVPEHVAHWHGLALRDYLGGPFEDRTGGLMTFRADAADAERAVAGDPFVRDRLLQTYWLKRWMPE